MKRGTRIAVYCGPLDGNSTARIAVRLANGFVQRGVDADLLVTASDAPVDEQIAPGVRVLNMGRMAALMRVPVMATYLLRNRPDAVLTHRIRENRFVLDAARLTRLHTPVFVTVHGRMSVKLAHLPAGKKERRTAQFYRCYRRNAGIVAISEDTAADTRALLGEDAPVVTIPNPIVSDELYRLAEAEVTHPWLSRRTRPVILFAGRLEREKDISTLLKAFARVRAGRDCALLIIGEGELRARLEAERAELGLTGDVDMPGWLDNPYPAIRAADQVVLSSFWDALPTVLIEALALGTPPVSTDCGAGPREILHNGRLGPLPPPRDPRALAEAMASALDHPLAPDVLRAGARRYDAQASADQYLRLMLGRDAGEF